MKIVGLDIGSTTVKAICVEDGKTIWRDYKRNNTNRPKSCSNIWRAWKANAD
jgi:activator of 2-hydroxyglutaryl-CoA dehydratase